MNTTTGAAGTSATRDDLVTGEAVVVALPYAGLAQRALSGGIDVVVQILLLVAGGYVLGRTTAGLDEALIAGLALLLMVAVNVVFPATLESLTGRTVGKLITGLRTVRNDGAPADARRIITRHLMSILDVWTGGGTVALVTGLLTEPTRRLGDLAAGTYVARDRVQLRLPPPPAMPPQLRAWAAGADLGRIPEDLVVMIRSTLEQRGEFTGEAGARVEAMLAERLARYVSPPPPPGTPTPAYLAAVLAERRRRDTDRLRAAAERRTRLFGVSR